MALNLKNPVIKIQDLSIAYSIRDGDLLTVDNVSVEFEQSKVTAVIGESGCGKSTLVNAIMGILAHNSILGKDSKIFYKEQNILNQTKEQKRLFRWQKASMVFQAAQNALNPTITVGEQLKDSIWDHNTAMSEIEIKKEVINLLRLVRLEPERIMESYPHQLSGGMRQRAIIAMALVLEPELILLDEPTTALDVITQSYVFDILNSIKAKGVSMILITHDIASAAKLADNIIVMYGGEIMESSPTELIFKKPIHPYTRGLLDAMPFIDGDIIKKKPIKGTPPDLINKPKGCIFYPRCPYAISKCKKQKPVFENISEELTTRFAACHRKGDNLK